MADDRAKWLDAPSDRTGVEIDILPSGFDTLMMKGQFAICADLGR